MAGYGHCGSPRRGTEWRAVWHADYVHIRAHLAEIRADLDRLVAKKAAADRSPASPRIVAPDGEILIHGNTTAYRAGCRCPACSEAKRVVNDRRPERQHRATLHPAERQRSAWRGVDGRRIWTEADNARVRASKPARPERVPVAPGELRARAVRSRAARRRAVQAGADAAARFRADLYRNAAAVADGELATLIAAQQADARSSSVRSISFDAIADESIADVWDDPTAEAALERTG